MSMQEVSVFSKDLREAAEVGSGTNIVGNYELHDLVQLELSVSFSKLSETPSVFLIRMVKYNWCNPHQISMWWNSNCAIATDYESHKLCVQDNVKEIEGESRKGQVLHIHQSFFTFLHNRDILENGSVFVTQCCSLALVAPKGNLIKPGMDLGKMCP
ncbi:uncharacterized protein EDB91DRAFT_1316334 [Suillus paluster]|uniref:uncharacterized protein n=1 Tax=Suillus paluster TaxID=48578 RepID=UPI001B86DB73|nr:uncharacterized protein EDB91DRAFT_1316334 [Suillus paluster]KAG1727075.1 hypothetical protein EDB91DRAFT_1316334 [Suillus paluster]